ncbi:MAG: hypothetical protein EOQ48_14090 [Mesorhizobium sp.]|uniref:hypothetical protein n=1 Tax=Mesorhizobium sp. TaxID=1871066 RepID=UPI000FE4F125|nr:MAG: hypothetical protein EOQ48_14090 [Mesorhizobium sp.]
MNDQDDEDSDCELIGDERAWAHLEGGIPAYGQGYGSGFRSQLQRAIWGDNEDDLLYDAPSAKRQRKAQRDKRQFITRDQFFELYDAVCFANSRGWVMNVTVDIQPGNLGIVGHDEIFKTFRIWLARYRDWCSQRHIESIYIYLWERPPDRSLHVHMMCHIPDILQAEFEDWAYASIRSLTKPGSLWVAPDIKTRKKATAANQWFAFRYRIKGLSPEIYLPGTGPRRALADQIGVRAEPQGEIGGKRVGSSRVISWKARREAQDKATFIPLACDGDTPADAFWTDMYLRPEHSLTPERLF